MKMILIGIIFFALVFGIYQRCKMRDRKEDETENQLLKSQDNPHLKT